MALAFNTETLIHVAVILPQRLFLDIIYSSSCSQDRNYSLMSGTQGRHLNADATCGGGHSSRAVDCRPAEQKDIGGCIMRQGRVAPIPTGAPDPAHQPPLDFQRASPYPALTFLKGFPEPLKAGIPLVYLMTRRNKQNNNKTQVQVESLP